MYGFYYFDPTYLLLIIGMVLSLLASAKVKSTFSVYSRVRSASKDSTIPIMSSKYVGSK
jgi:Zn-dependent membrane protease YugP